MRWMPLALLLLAGCSEKKTSAGDGKPETGDRKKETEEAPGCTPRPFAETVDVREASGAVWVAASFGWPAHIVVVGDSGTKGAFAVVDADDGALLGKGNLPLGEGVSDDIEGFARAGDLYHALTSNGRVRTYRRTGPTAFELIGAPYELHPDLVCPLATRSNCRYDFEGLCLAQATGPGCAGYAASRARGILVCVTVKPDGTLTADPGQTLAVAPPMVLSGCAIAPEGDLLYAGLNGFGGNAVVRVGLWRDPRTARKESLGPAGTGFCEAEAVGPGGALYRFSDTRATPSLMSALSCPPRPP
jgi:hypothetical protein